MMKEIKNKQKRMKKTSQGLIKARLNKEELKKSEERFHSLIYSIDDFIFTLDKDGRFVDYFQSPRKKKLYISPEKFIGKHFKEVLPPHIVKLIQEALRKIKRSDKIQQFDYPLKIKNKEMWFDAKISPLRSRSKTLTGFTAVVRDITERKKIEKELLFKTTLLSAQSEASIDGILIVDENDKAISFNQRFVELWSIPKKIVDMRNDKKMLNFVVSQLRYPKKFLDKVNYLYKHKKEKSRDEIEFKDERVLDRYSTPLVTDDKQYLGRIWYFRDITEHKQIDRAKTEFVSLASHQLRSPLTGIKWFIDLLSSKKSGKLNEKQKEYLKEIDDINQRLIGLVNALLNVSRIELGVFAIEPKPISFTKIADSVLELLAPEIEKKKLQIRKNYDKNLRNIKADPNLVRIIFQNLLSNAVKYTPRGGRISLTIKKQEPNVLIKLSDTGYGIPKNQQTKIFEKLFRADNIRETEPDGTGLGLYIVKSVVEQPGGKIWFKSEENKGTTFYVTFPLKGMKRKEGIKGLS